MAAGAEGFSESLQHWGESVVGWMGSGEAVVDCMGPGRPVVGWMEMGVLHSTAMTAGVPLVRWSAIGLVRRLVH